jgi:hypothetical protein
MAGTLILNSISPDVGTNLYLNATQGAGNVVIGNTTTALATFTNAGTLIVSNVVSNLVGNVIGNIANTNITGLIIATQGGTGLTSPGTTGNVLTSNGSTWISSALPAGGVTSAVAGNGVAVSSATGAVTFSAACPTFNTVGSYVFGGGNHATSGFNFTAGSNYSAGNGNGQAQAYVTITDGLYGFYQTPSNILSGTWKWMGATNTTFSGYGGTSMGGLMCRVS